MMLETRPAMEGQLAYQQTLPILAVRLRGELILPGDSDYEAARGVRLAALKRRYDPTNLFHLNQNIKPINM